MARTSLRSHLSGSVPISIALHLVALFLIFVIPLVANVVVPTVIVTLPDYVQPLLPPPPEVVVRAAPRAAADPAPIDRTPTIPIVAPNAISPEREIPPSTARVPGPPDSSALGEPGGLPPGFMTSAPPPRPPEPAKPSGPVRVGDLPIAPRKTVDARPIYPDIARMARIEGTVVMEAVLDPSGHVTQPRIIRSIPMLDQAALDAVRQWRYTPSVYNGQPVSVLMTITIRFTLQ